MIARIGCRAILPSTPTAGRPSLLKTDQALDSELEASSNRMWRDKALDGACDLPVQL